VGLLDVLAGGTSGERSSTAVTRHLQRLLGSLQGYSCLRSDYGVRGKALLGVPGPDDDAKLPEERLRQELLRNLLKFEPALREPELTTCSRDAQGRLYFLLSAGLSQSEPRFNWGIRFNVWSRELTVEEVAT
jgi:hypothetical protein